MLLTLFQKLCGVLACVMCIFILGPIAMVIESTRVVRSWILHLPHDYSNFRAVYPMFITFTGIMIVIWALLDLLLV